MQNTQCARTPKGAARASGLCHHLSIFDAAWEITYRVLHSPEGARAWAPFLDQSHHQGGRMNYSELRKPLHVGGLFIPSDRQTGSKCVGPGRVDQKLRTYDSLFPALMHTI